MNQLNNLEILVQFTGEVTSIFIILEYWRTNEEFNEQESINEFGIFLEDLLFAELQMI